jgi:RNA-binding protein 15
MIPRLQKQLGSGVMLDPTGVLRDQEGKYIPDRFNRAQMSTNDNSSSRRRHSPPPPENHRRDHDRHHNNNNTTNSGGGRLFNLNREDNQATRTLFVGNLPGDIRQSELRKIFEDYGQVESVDIKQVNDGHAAFGFVVFQVRNSRLLMNSSSFQSVEHAMKALKKQHDRSVGKSYNKCQIGYGRSQVSTRLWVGGLGEWSTKDMLMKEFDRYGVIEKIDYSSGDSYGYIR